MQEVLQADWQEAWHSPQPPFAADFFRFALLSVLICFIAFSLLCNIVFIIIAYCDEKINICSVFDPAMLPIYAEDASQHSKENGTCRFNKQEERSIDL